MAVNAPDFPDLPSAVAALPDGGTLYLPSDRAPYPVPDGATLDFSHLGSFTIKGDGFRAGSNDGSHVQGNVLGPLVKFCGVGTGHSFAVEGVSLRNIHAAGECVRAGNFVCGIVRRVQLTGFIGYMGTPDPTVGPDVTNGNNTSLHFDDCKLNGGGRAGSIGIVATSHTSITATDVTGWGEGVRASGTGVSYRDSRIEVCGVGLRLGVLPNGGNWALSRSVYSGLSMEACGTFIELGAANGVTFESIGMQGSTNAPGGQSLYGIHDVGGGHGNEFRSVLVGGMFVKAGVRLDPIPGTGRKQRWSMCEVKNGLGKGWDLPGTATALGRVVREYCD